ncbi:penicillin-binding transpeptidase domain-containing protein [Paenibacillus sp. PK4536]|uniref:penicillin-binding transpeptidase domain-containing protein n=1 Tax=Paenibacillus sp. PK4536 TaxID=3024576 RepID=UPI002359C22B|nr:penicillin-binding transpeptidase domain-containing protein [Paenibacillus sp. PK4536]WIM39030.1 penicillin-binding transpeptidase domain-containing protein [Paenibacillus sp. PK4536]
MNKRIKLRTLFIGGCITLFFAVLITKVFWLQVVQSGDWTDKAINQWTANSNISAKRGTITDRNGNDLAMDAPAYNVALNPRVIDKYGIKGDVVSQLHAILGTDETEIEKQATSVLTSGDEIGQLRTWRELNSGGRLIDQEKADQINAFVKQLKEKTGQKWDVGVYLSADSKRYYPKNELAAHVIGYTNKDGNAVAGIEAYYDEKLKGTDGHIQYLRDKQGDKLPDSKDVYTPAKNGDNLTLTIDETIQYYIEQAMKDAYEQLKPESITVIAADPNTMEILGMANMPTFNPNKFNEVTDPKDFRNLAVKAIYEPGSTFKIVTLSGAVQENLFNPNARYQSGSIQVGRTTLHDLNHSGWGTISYLEGLKRSSNVAFVNLGYKMLGAERLRKYIDAFGFGEQTGIETPGEAKGAINFHPNIPTEVATAAYGHGLVQVTPIQQLAAISAVANGGKLLTPHLVKSITDPNTGVTENTQTKVVRQVIDSATSEKVRGYLEQVVSDQDIGTGRHAYIDGYRVAGKTGTAVKVINGKYDYTKQVVSFVGFAPANDPKIAMIVVIDQPSDSKLGGGTAAAPVFKKIVSQVLPYMGISKVFDDGETKPKAEVASKKLMASYTAPTLTGKMLADAKKKLLADGISYTTVGSGTKVVKQYPASGAAMTGGQTIYLMTEDPTKMSIPDLKGESLRDALQILSLMKVEVTATGEGYVSEQVEASSGGRRSVTLTLKSARATVTGVDDTEEDPATSEEATAPKDGETDGKTTSEGSSTDKETSTDPKATESKDPTTSDTQTDSSTTEGKTGSSTSESSANQNPASSLEIPEPTGAPTN